jgi:ribonuclease VapC
MIAVDTSALMAIALKEPDGDACLAALEAADEVVISAGTVSEMLIVSTRQASVRLAVKNLMERFGFNVIAVTQASAERIGNAYERWGRGFHPAGLNFGDCFAYEVAKEHGCPLLFVGDDFAKTDIRSVL